ncbi:hypothetical protein GCM10009609_40210 [Pseudonocardia aurantiaca]
MALSLAILVGVLLIAGIAVASLFIDGLAVTTLLAVWASTEKYSETLLAIATADGRTTINAASMLIRRGLALAAMVAVAVIGVPPLEAFCIGLASGSAIGAIATAGLILPCVKPGGRSSFKQVIVEARPFWLYTASGQARVLDVSLVTAASGGLAGGIYSVPARIMGPLRLLAGVLSTLVIPYATRSDGRGMRSLGIACLSLLTVMACGLAGLSLMAEQAVVWSLGSDYLAAVVPLQIFCLGILASSIAAILQGFLHSWGDEWFVGITETAVTFALLLGVVLGAHFGGAVGASVGATGAYLSGCAALLLRIRAIRLRSARIEVGSAYSGKV